MKNSILYCLAAGSLALSFFFERAPDASITVRATAAPAVAEASLFPDLMMNERVSEVSEPAAAPANTPATKPATAAELAASRDSLAYHYYAQTLGLRLAFDENKDLLRTVTDWIGTPYRYGNNTRRGTDCSGFVTRVFREVYGVTLQRSSRSMFTTTKHVAKSEMKTGDLVFFRRGRGPIYHVGIYLKDGKFAHSACNGGVMVSSLNQPYYHRNFYAAGRVRAAEEANETAD
ncbi:NlpC/P60 family protein [Hymenobacter sp. BT770]|uniref:C40 family peptidase n=1 Tax=Hymenobacter sp. BT770 TaxID=2886942 RepID=UPI001D121BCE|nr:NlpC/P60 family protein [Hymenobacter sp. BT770]MCC3153412.1 NlpC/P60 family protein [Hymenobacter sp. BT770]MDO3415506.1 NlpC/P60 family protein [Hymenobacter sp. BT770]